MKRLSTLLATTFALATLAAGCGGSDDEFDSTLTIRNNSSFAFIEINLSPVDSASFGPDLLGSDILEPGTELEISGIACDDYDIRIIDEDADECILTDVDLCFDDAVWNITDGELAACIF